MIIEIIVIATLAALAGGTALNWNRVIIAVKGKKLAVLGARAVGKTHLLTFLRSGEIPTEYKQTATAQKVPSERRQLKDLELILKETLDLPGGQRHYREWKQLYRESDLVLYLFRVDKIVARDREIEERIQIDLEFLDDWRQIGDKQPQVFLIGTHCDLDPNYTEATAKNKDGDYADSFNKLPFVVESIGRLGGTGKAKLILGSMKTKEDTERLVYTLLKQVA